MKNRNLTTAWKQYEEGRAYKRTIGLYRRVDENERFYRGDQWRGVEAGGLPTPVFNLIKRIGSYLVSAVLSYKLTVRYTDLSIPYADPSDAVRHRQMTLEGLNRITACRWKQSGMDLILRRALYDAVLSGDGIFYCCFDPDLPGAGDFVGDIRTTTLDSVNLFAADMNSDDLQSQDWLILSGRASVESLREEAARFGVSADEIDRIRPDRDYEDGAGDYAGYETGDKATYLIRFYRNADGFVCWEKSTREVVLHSVQTGMRRYPLAMFHWDQVKNSFHGSSPLTELIQNQKYVNKAYAMLMKHMVDTAFSKVIYDKRLIPEWSNEVGEAIGVLSGGDVSGVATTIGVGEMQDGYTDLIKSVIDNTKELTGATDIVLGEADPTNTSAIIALREAAEVPLDQVRASLTACIESLALIWLEMMREYFPDARAYAMEDQSVSLVLSTLPLDAIGAYVDSGASKRFSQSMLISTLQHLLAEGHITFAEYLERLPDGVLTEKDKLLARARGEEADKEAGGING
jgi:hypothetical protein